MLNIIFTHYKIEVSHSGIVWKCTDMPNEVYYTIYTEGGYVEDDPQGQKNGACHQIHYHIHLTFTSLPCCFFISNKSIPQYSFFLRFAITFNLQTSARWCWTQDQSNFLYSFLWDIQIFLHYLFLTYFTYSGVNVTITHFFKCA